MAKEPGRWCRCWDCEIHGRRQFIVVCGLWNRRRRGMENGMEHHPFGGFSRVCICCPTSSDPRLQRKLSRFRTKRKENQSTKGTVRCLHTWEQSFSKEIQSWLCFGGKFAWNVFNMVREVYEITVKLPLMWIKLSFSTNLKFFYNVLRILRTTNFLYEMLNFHYVTRVFTAYVWYPSNVSRYTLMSESDMFIYGLRSQAAKHTNYHQFPSQILIRNWPSVSETLPRNLPYNRKLYFPNRISTILRTPS